MLPLLFNRLVSRKLAVTMTSSRSSLGVSCATAAQARGIKEAFSRAECLLNADDPRQAAFTVLPGHGLVIAEKWQDDKAPFELLWSYMDSGDLVIDPHVPQGEMAFEVEDDKLMHLREDREVF